MVYWNKREGAAYARRSRGTIMRWVAAGLISPPKRYADGGPILFDSDVFRAEIDALLAKAHAPAAAHSLTDDLRAASREVVRKRRQGGKAKARTKAQPKRPKGGKAKEAADALANP